MSAKLLSSVYACMEVCILFSQRQERHLALLWRHLAGLSRLSTDVVPRCLTAQDVVSALVQAKLDQTVAVSKDDQGCQTRRIYRQALII